jgi:hypothetical protein
MHNHKFEWRNCNGSAAGLDTPSPVLPQKLAVCGPNFYTAAAMGGVDVKPVLCYGPPVYGYHYPVVAAAPAADNAPVVKPEPQGANIPLTIRVRNLQGRL